MTAPAPNPSVAENFLSSSTTVSESELLPCVIGSLVQVVDNNAITLALPITGSTVINYPLQKPSSIINNSSVNIQIANAVVNVMSSTTGPTGSANSNLFTSTLAIFTNVLPGDILVIPTQGYYNTFVIENVSSDYEVLTLATDLITAVINTQAFTIQRNVGTVNATLGSVTYQSTSVTFSTLTYDTYTIISGTPTISYTAQRRDLIGFYSVNSLSQLAIDMDITPLNPLGFYLGNIMSGSSGSLTSLAYITPDNSENSYIAALGFLSARNDLYFVLPIVTNSSVNNDIAANVNSMSTSSPGPSFYRSGILPAMTEAQFLYNVLEASMSTTFAQCS